MPYDHETMDKVWQHGRVMTDLDPALWRKDECGAWMRREHYERPSSEFGWKIVNISIGGPDTVENLRPLQHANGYDRGEQHAHCKVTADQTDSPATARVREPRNRPA
jgi:hypothetical protein